MTVDTTVTVTMLSVPMTTVGVTIPFGEEEEVGVDALDVLTKGRTGDRARDATGEDVEGDEDVKDII